MVVVLFNSHNKIGFPQKRLLHALIEGRALSRDTPLGVQSYCDVAPDGSQLRSI